MRAALLPCLVALAGCSLVLDGDRHTGGDPGGADAGSGLDAGPGVDAGPGGGGPVPASEFCDELTDVICSAEQGCCSSPRSEEDCRLAVDSACQSEFGPAAMDRRTGYDGEIAREVLDEGRAIASDCNEAAAQQWAVYRIIDVFQGTTPRGEMCESAAVPDPIQLLSCERPYVCRLTGYFWVRECLPHVPEGGECFESIDCEPGLYCDTSGEPKVCAEALPAGEPCATPYACQSLLCSGPDTGATCQALTQDAVFCGLVDDGTEG